MEPEISVEKPTQPYRMSSIEESIQLARLQQIVNASALYERNQNQKALKVLTVAAYMIFVSMAAIILSFYYVFIWDPTGKQLPPRATNCGELNPLQSFQSMGRETKQLPTVGSPSKVVIPESLAIQLANSSQLSAEAFYNKIYRRYQQTEKQTKHMRKSSRKSSHRISSPQMSELKANASQIDGHLDERNITMTTDELDAMGDGLDELEVNVIKMPNREYDSYMDDEDVERAYDDAESSGFFDRARLKVNDTYDDEVGIDWELMLESNMELKL